MCERVRERVRENLSYNQQRGRSKGGRAIESERASGSLSLHTRSIHLLNVPVMQTEPPDLETWHEHSRIIRS